ncbi:hypothetical protein NDU88_007971 [Pleurodeles waltl]|uniref:Uncharacterized protein n=1 Tax=Pleurodeles waltl TaxID=8319 RepID=A0AAV7RRU3_PLEWA|nr:hypothetical protein NDU88_007971 [Pleurodeles waltl]
MYWSYLNKLHEDTTRKCQMTSLQFWRRGTPRILIVACEEAHAVINIATIGTKGIVRGKICSYVFRSRMSGARDMEAFENGRSRDGTVVRRSDVAARLLYVLDLS